MKYAELKNTAGSHLIDDTYENLRLIWTQSTLDRPNPISGIHVEVNDQGERICTLPYLDYANNRTFLWEKDASVPLIRGGYHPEVHPPEPFRMLAPRYYIGSPFEGFQSPVGYGTFLARPTIALLGRFRRFTRSNASGQIIPPIFALASAMPNTIYTFTQYARKKDFYLMEYPCKQYINLWQRAASVTLPIYDRGTFSGTDVGYTELERVAPYPSSMGFNCYFKAKDNEKFQHWTFKQEAQFSTMVYIYGLDESEVKRDRGELIVKNDRGETIFNNRYDYMRILKYLPSINALALNGDNLYNAPKRFSFPGRKIAVAALHPYCCIANRRKGERGYIFNTGFWFPDPSTVEFTSCASLIGTNFEGFYTAHQNFVNMAELVNVMILDVTGCTPGWRLETQYGESGIIMA